MLLKKEREEEKDINIEYLLNIFSVVRMKLWEASQRSWVSTHRRPFPKKYFPHQLTQPSGLWSS